MTSGLFKSILNFFSYPLKFFKRGSDSYIFKFNTGLKERQTSFNTLKQELVLFANTNTVKECEKWLFTRIHNVWIELNKLDKRGTKNQKKLIISSAICKNAAEMKAIQECFIFLNDLYKKKNNNPDALRMLQVALVFGKLPENEFKWAMETVLEIKKENGFWLGEAALHYTSNGKSDHSRRVIEKSAKSGIELSQFILSINE